jgi:hypothetical protein
MESGNGCHREVGGSKLDVGGWILKEERVSKVSKV